MEQKFYFPVPRQVLFVDPDGGKYAAGIAFGNQIICGCCGGVFEVEEIIEMAKEHTDGPAIKMYREWEPISDAIKGGDDYGDYTDAWTMEEN